MATSFTKGDIEQLLELLNDELAKDGVSARVYLVGGAVMCLAFDARRSTKDLDAYFLPATKVRAAARRVATRREIDPSWLNDGVKAYMNERGRFDSYLEMSNLKVFVAQPETMLAMKCLAMRLGAEFRDEDDVRYLLRNLDINTYERAIEIITKYYPLKQFPQKTLYALEEILRDSES